MKIHHIGIITNNIYKSTEIFKELGFIVYQDLIQDLIQNNNIIFLKCSNDILLELIEPINENSTVYNAPIGLHHICYDISKYKDMSIMDKIEKMRLGKIITKSVRAPAINNREIVFGYLKNDLLIELIIT